MCLFCVVFGEFLCLCSSILGVSVLFGLLGLCFSGCCLVLWLLLLLRSCFGCFIDRRVWFVGCYCLAGVWLVVWLVVSIGAWVFVWCRFGMV